MTGKKASKGKRDWRIDLQGLDVLMDLLSCQGGGLGRGGDLAPKRRESLVYGVRTCRKGSSWWVVAAMEGVFTTSKFRPAAGCGLDSKVQTSPVSASLHDSGKDNLKSYCSV